MSAPNYNTGVIGIPLYNNMQFANTNFHEKTFVNLADCKLQKNKQNLNLTKISSIRYV